MDVILSVLYGFLLRKSGFKRAKTGKIPAYRAAFGPRYVARDCPGQGVPGECGNGPPPGRARVTVGAGCKCLGRDGKCLEASRREK